MLKGVAKKEKKHLKVLQKMSRKGLWIIAYIGALMIGFICGGYTNKPVVPKKYSNYVFPYHDYVMASYGDTILYKNVVRERKSKTPSHPDYLDLSILIATKYGHTSGYYNAYLALHDLYAYNHFHMGDKVKRLMYSYLQLAIEHKDKRVTDADLKGFHAAFPDGKAI